MPDLASRATVLLADDHPVVLHGLAALLAAHPQFEVVATMSDGAAALAGILDRRPALAVLDVNMPGLSGIEIVQRLQGVTAPTRVVVLSASVTEEQVAAAYVAGAAGLLFKDAAADQLAECLGAVLTGERRFPSALLNAGARAQDLAPQDGYAARLTARERELVDLVAEGLPNKVIARRLGLSDGTVKVHLHNVYQKLGVDNRTTLAALALRKANGEV